MAQNGGSAFGELWRRAGLFKTSVYTAAALSSVVIAVAMQSPPRPPEPKLKPGLSDARFAAPPAEENRTRSSAGAAGESAAAQAVQEQGGAPRRDAPARPVRPPAAASPSSPPAPSAAASSQPIAPVAPNASLPKPAGEAPDKSLMGRTFSDRIPVQGRPMPLPPGEWTVVAHFPAVGATGVESLFLARIADRKLSAAAIIQAGQLPADRAVGYRQASQCNRTALIYRKTAANEDFGPQDCLTLNHNLSSEWNERNNAPVIRAAMGELGVRGVATPPVMVSAYYRLADKEHFLNAVYYFNPESEGISTTPTPVWDDSDWHREHLSKYPEKVAYVRKLISWAEGWQPRVREAFKSAPSGATVQGAK